MEPHLLAHQKDHAKWVDATIATNLDISLKPVSIPKPVPSADFHTINRSALQHHTAEIAKADPWVNAKFARSS
jgi:hypothetical protein